jgi:hypothetical protein
MIEGAFDAQTGIVFLEHFHHEMLCNYDWRKMLQVMHSHRCLFAQGLVYHPAFEALTIHVDGVVINFDQILCRDIISSTYNQQEPVVFHNGWKSGLNLALEKRDF